MVFSHETILYVSSCSPHVAISYIELHLCSLYTFTSVSVNTSKTNLLLAKGIVILCHVIKTMYT